MQVSVEKESSVKRKLTIVVPSEEVEEAYKTQINQFIKKANIKGFRPGKAPRSYIEQRYGKDARYEAMSDLIQKSLSTAMRDNHLQPVNTPEVTPKIPLANEPLEFTASFEVLPEIEKVVTTQEQVEKLIVDISAEDIDHVIHQLIKQHAEWNKIERPAQEKDLVVIDYEVIMDGKSVENKTENFSLELGSKKMIPGFEQGLIGIQKGEQRTLQLHFPEDFHNKDYAGKPVEFVITAHDIFSAKFPELNEAFIKKLGVQSGLESDLQKQIRQTLELERDRLVKEKLKEQVFRQLLDKNPLEVPPSLIAKEAKNIHDEIYAKEAHDHHQHTDKEMAVFDEIAKKRISLSLLISEYAKQNQIKVDESRVLTRIQEIAQVYENPQEVLKWLSSRERLAGIEAQVLEDQVLEKLLENIPSTEKTANYADLKGLHY